MGVPGTQTFDITFTIAAASSNVTDTAYIMVDPRSGVTDPLLLNNCSIAGYVGSGGGTVGTGDTQTGAAKCAFLDATSPSQVEQVTFSGLAGSVDIQETIASCAAQGPIGIGRCMHFNYSGTSDFTKVFVMNLATITAAGQTYGSVGIFWVDKNEVLSSCGANPATNPCVTDKTKFKIGGATFVKITIKGKDIPDGGYGWQ